AGRWDGAGGQQFDRRAAAKAFMQHRSTHQPDVNAARDQLAIQPDVLRVVLVIVVAAQAPNDKRLGPLGSWSGPEQIEIVKPASVTSGSLSAQRITSASAESSA